MLAITQTFIPTAKKVASSLTVQLLPDQDYRMEIAQLKVESTKQMLQILISTDLISGHMFVIND